jgi:hypothetical protein
VPAPIRKEESRRLQMRAFELEKRAREQNVPELKDLAAAMREAAELIRKPEVRQNEALAKISNLEEKARERREELARDAAFSQNFLKKPEAGGDSSDSTQASKKAAELDRKLSELQAKVDAAQKMLTDDAKGGADSKELKEALMGLADELKGLEGQSFDELERQLQEMGENGAPADRESLEKLLESLEGELDELDDTLDEWDLLEDELEMLQALKGKFAGRMGKCPYCDRLGEG